MTTIGQKSYLSIATSNDGSSGIFGGAGLATAGPQQLRFEVANRGMLQTPELRLQGTLRVRAVATGASLGAAGMATDVNLNPMCGVQSTIDNLEISSRVNSTRSIERILNYGHLASSLTSTLHGKTSYDTQLFHEQGCKGNGVSCAESTMAGVAGNAQGHQSRSGGLPQPAAPSAVTTTQLIGSTSTIGVKRTPAPNPTAQLAAGKRALMSALGMPFDMRIVAGMFMGQDAIDLEALGGMALTINLAPPAQVLGGANAAAYTYEIVNPRLVVPIIEKTPEEQQATAAQPVTTMSFLTYQSLYQTLTSTSQQMVSRVSYQGLVSMFQHYIPVSHLQNSTVDSFAQYNPGIQQLIFLKDGKRQPLEYAISPVVVPNVVQVNQPSFLPTTLWQGMDAFRNTRDVTKSLINPQFSGYGQQLAVPSTCSAAFVTGCSYDDVSHQGIDASASTVGFEITSTLDDPLNRATATPFASFSYLLTRTVVQADRAGGISIMS